MFFAYKNDFGIAGNLWQDGNQNLANNPNL